MRHIVTLGLGGLVVMGVVIYNKLSGEALAVLAGGILVAAVLIPAFLLVIVAMRRSQREPERPVQQPQHPPVIVVGGIPQQVRQDPNAVDSTWRAVDAPRREFRVIGEE